MKRVFAFTALLLAPSLTCAQPGDADRKYDLQVVLRCGAHNWLGKQFRDDLRSNLAGMLTDALGEMAAVSVVDLKELPPEQWPPLWKDVDARGLGALDSAHELDGVKTHFLRIDFVNGQYQVQARQFDGQTGQVSPWRRERTADRAFVTRMAGKMIAQDFGLIGTVVSKGGPAREGEVPVRVHFRAGGQRSLLDRWVKRGDVFALMTVLSAARGSDGKERVSPVPYTLVQMTGNPENGECDARVLYRSRDNPLGATGAFRCIKMGTVNGPMRLRLVDEKGQAHARTLQVRVHPEAFQSGESREEEVLNPDRGGAFVSRKSYDQIAFVRVITGARQIARVPVPIQDDREVVVAVSLDPAQEEAGQLQALRADLRRKYDESVLVQIDSYKEVSKLVTATKNVEALKRAMAARKGLEEDLERLHAEKEEVKKKLAGGPINVADCDEAEVKLEGHKVRINRLIGQLEETERLANSPDKIEKRVKLKDLSNKAQVAMDTNDYDTALSIYRQIAKEYPEETAIKSALEKLEKGWEIKSEAHHQARDFAYKEWPALRTAADVEAKLPTARQKLQVLAGVGDPYTIIKLRDSIPEIGKGLAAEVQALTQDNPDDTEKKAKLKKVIEDLQRYSEEIDAALKKAE